MRLLYSGIENNYFQRKYLHNFLLGFLCLIYLIFQKSDLENRIIHNYSIVLIVLISITTIISCFMLFGFFNHEKIIRNRIIYSKWLNTILFSASLFVLLVISALFCLGYFAHLSLAQSFLNRLFIFLLFLSSVCFICAYTNSKLQNEKLLNICLQTYQDSFEFIKFKVNDLKLSDYVSIIIILVIVSPFYLSFPLQNNMPIGAAGLFSLMSEMIGDNGLNLPDSIPYYGPGGMPFAYPPFGFITMALFTRGLNVSTFDYLVWAPGIFSILSMIAIYLFFSKLAGKVCALVSVLLVFGSDRLFIIHNQAPGVIRGLAFLLLMSGLYLLLLYLDSKKITILLLCILTGSLTILTHLSYGMFFCISAFIILIFNKNPVKIGFKNVTLIFMGVFFVTSPWWIHIIRTHGINVFMYALKSHNNINQFVGMFEPGKFIIENFLELLRINEFSPLLIGLSIVGFIHLVLQRNYIIPILFIISLLISEGDRYQIIFEGLMSASLILSIFSNNGYQKRSRNRSTIFGSIIIIILINFYPSFKVVTEIYKPVLNESVYNFIEWYEISSNEETTYLFIGETTDYGEWFPYLLKNTPRVATWGAEWNGIYHDQLEKLMDLEECAKNISSICIENEYIKYEPDILILENGYESGIINEQLIQLGFENLFVNELFSVYSR